MLALRCTRATALNKDLPQVPHALQVVLLALGQRDVSPFQKKSPRPSTSPMVCLRDLKAA